MDTGEGEELEIIDRTELDITDTGVTDEEINITDLREELEFADTGVTDEELESQDRVELDITDTGGDDEDGGEIQS